MGPARTFVLSGGRGFTTAVLEVRPIRTELLQFDLPGSLIAQHPSEPRDACRLMVVDRATGDLQHMTFRDLPGLLRPGDCLVRNKTRVLPARFSAKRRTGGLIGGLFVGDEGPGTWTVLLNGAGRLGPGEILSLGDGAWTLSLMERGERGACRVSIEPADPAAVILERIGRAPLPPYIHRAKGADTEFDRRDLEDYQTVYASVPGAIAAPTAGMHFTPATLRQIGERDVQSTDVVLHVGVGTFAAVEVEDLADHAMHREWFELGEGAAATINHARASGGRICAVGTTSVRVLETCVGAGAVRSKSGWTDILIYPPYSFGATDVLLTNFHLPGSTLLALVFAFAGRELAMAAYQSAIEEEYRFYSYGDAMLVV